MHDGVDVAYGRLCDYIVEQVAALPGDAGRGQVGRPLR
jgi:hypothetical protein